MPLNPLINRGGGGSGGPDWKSLDRIRSLQPLQGLGLGLKLEGGVTSDPGTEPAGVVQTSPCSGTHTGTCFSHGQGVLSERIKADLTFLVSGIAPCSILQVLPNPWEWGLASCSEMVPKKIPWIGIQKLKPCDFS